MPDSMIGRHLGRYRIDGSLGQGGMGEVFSAFDTSLEREVAVKVIRPDDVSDELRTRFVREARGAASVNHPNVCQVFEIGEDGGTLFIAMEKLEGEPLADRIARGALSVGEALRIALGILDALEAIHERKLVHRDLKPSNVFLLPGGRPKLLDFGLVRTIGGSEVDRTAKILTAHGALLGSPAYMAPEQIRSAPVDGRTDLFAAAVVVWEMVSGSPPFRGKTVGELLAAILTDEPEPLEGAPVARQLDRVLRRSLAKRPSDRHPDAASLAADLREVLAGVESSPGARELPPGRGTRELAAPARRLAVLPFRFLRPDAELDFLGFSLADAIASSLANLDGVLVRSTAAASSFVGAAPDLAALAGTLDVDVVLLGTILTAAGKCRVQAQLVETPGGKLLSSTSVDSSVDDVFGLQDELSRRIVEALEIPLGGRGPAALAGGVPASPHAYELFLRANAAAMAARDFTIARSLYRRCVEEDPGFAPGWARLGRLHRFEAKYHPESGPEHWQLAEEALSKALRLNPDLGAAHLVYAYMDTDRGRAEAAVERLLELTARRPRESEAWSGLVAPLRFLGLLEESMAAHRRAVAIDPDIVTSFFHTLIAFGRWEEALASSSHESIWRTNEASLCLFELGRIEEGKKLIRDFLESGPMGFVREFARMIQALLEDDRALIVESSRSLTRFPDPEGICYLAAMTAHAGERGVALEMLGKSVAGGYSNPRLVESWRFFDPIRSEAAFVELLGKMRIRSRAAAARFGRCV